MCVRSGQIADGVNGMLAERMCCDLATRVASDVKTQFGEREHLNPLRRLL